MADSLVVEIPRVKHLKIPVDNVYHGKLVCTPMALYAAIRCAPSGFSQTHTVKQTLGGTPTTKTIDDPESDESR